MTGSPGQHDLARRRHVDKLRADLELKSVPHYVGSELRTLTRVVGDRLRLRLAGDELASALSPGGQERLLSALGAAVEEFARIVEDRPPPSPPVAAVLVEIVHTEGAESSLIVLNEALDTVRTVMREQWKCLPHSRSHMAHLGVALDRYADRLRTTVTSPPRALHELLRADYTRPEDLLAEVMHRWGDESVELRVMVGALPTQCDTTLPVLQLHSIDMLGRHALRPLRLIAADHVLLVSEHRPPAPGPVRPDLATIWIGPVFAEDVSAAYETALLRLRLVDAGVAPPPPATLLPLPDLGFLRARPTEHTVTQIADLLRPLTQQSAHRRCSLARTLHLWLRTGGTAQALAQQLRLSAQSARNHLEAVRKLYQLKDLDFGRHTLTIQAALDLVLPLWDLETTASRTSPRTREPRRQPTPAALTPIESPT